MKRFFVFLLKLSIAFSYLVLGAEWKPSYDIRIQTKTQTAQLFYYGTIINNTTEDWKEVLSLSVSLSLSFPLSHSY
jgi:hypothetical protein